MADQLHLEIVTPQRRILQTSAEWVTIPGIEGEIGVLPEHVPLVTSVESGILSYSDGGSVRRVAVHHGYAQVQGNHITVLPEVAETGAEIDMDRARRAEQRAREELERIQREQNEEDRMKKYEAKLKRSMVRQQLGD
jgi:F-type H+-transporting ATPase subunit epsilon